MFPGIARYDRFLPRIAFCFHPSQHLFCFPVSAPGTRAVSDGQLAWWLGFNTDGEEEILVLIGNPKNEPEFCALSKWNTVYPETRQSFLNPTQRRHASRDTTRSRSSQETFWFIGVTDTTFASAAWVPKPLSTIFSSNWLLKTEDLAPSSNKLHQA